MSSVSLQCKEKESEEALESEAIAVFKEVQAVSCVGFCTRSLLS